MTNPIVATTETPAATFDKTNPDLIKINDGSMQKTEGIPSNLNLKDPRNIAKVAVMPNASHPDLIGAIYNEMIIAGSNKDAAEDFLNHFLCTGARGTSIAAQRTAVTSYLTYIFGPYGERAYAARNYVTMMNNAVLVNDILELFRSVPLDMFLKMQQPDFNVSAGEPASAAE